MPYGLSNNTRKQNDLNLCGINLSGIQKFLNFLINIIYFFPWLCRLGFSTNCWLTWNANVTSAYNFCEQGCWTSLFAGCSFWIHTPLSIFKCPALGQAFLIESGFFCTLFSMELLSLTFGETDCLATNEQNCMNIYWKQPQKEHICKLSTLINRNSLCASVQL